MSNWLSQNWFTFLQSAGIIASLLFTTISLRIDAKVRRISNLIKMTEQHHALWAQLIDQPGLSRVLSDAANLQLKPITNEERWFVTLLILHLSTAHHAMKDGMLIRPEGLKNDIQWFFSLTTKPFQDKEFVAFIEQSISNA